MPVCVSMVHHGMLFVVQALATPWMALPQSRPANILVEIGRPRLVVGHRQVVLPPKRPKDPEWEVPLGPPVEPRPVRVGPVIAGVLGVVALSVGTGVAITVNNRRLERRLR